ncbi:MAG: epoxyqueuosine reductase [Candidatus Hydrogenedentota bacterium]|nr:MAG: epoxyqueuosine reductase [Candidatus Hydrogenedentota bacterium]
METYPDERDDTLTEEVSICLRSAGAELVGFAEPTHFGKYGGGFRPENILPTTRTVIVIGSHLFDPMPDAWVEYGPWNRPRSFLDELLLGAAQSACLMLERHGFRSETVPYQPGLLLKNAAAIAGMGFIGQNNLFVSAMYGPRVRLRAAATEAPLVCGTPAAFRPECQDCVKCIEACPAKALSEAGYSYNRCLAYQRGHLLSPFRGATIWCNICADVCPVGRKGFGSTTPA